MLLLGCCWQAAPAQLLAQGCYCLAALLLQVAAVLQAPRVGAAGAAAAALLLLLLLLLAGVVEVAALQPVEGEEEAQMPAQARMLGH
jgi:hypothetical protein